MRSLISRRLLAALVVVLTLALVAALTWRRHLTRAITVTAGRFPEELVYVQANDGIIDGGAAFTPPRELAKPIAVIWIHGWGTNFYDPAYVMIGRALADLGYTCIVGNTRMHDTGNIQWIGDKRIRAGGYWGVASEQVRDIAAWIGFAEARGFKQVVLVGHSAGWAAVTQYQAEAQDGRVVGVVIASGSIYPGTGPTDRDQIAQATRMLADGHPDELVRDPKRSFPSYISAATMMDIVNTPPEFKDFFGTRTETRNPAVTRIRVPLLAFFGTNGDVGSGAELELLKSSLQRQSSGPRQITTVMVKDADHMYTGEERQVAQIIVAWIAAFPR